MSKVAEGAARTILAIACAAYAACLVLSARPSHAQDAAAATTRAAADDRVQARLEYSRAASAERCPDEAELREAVTTRLGFTVFDDATATRLVRVHIEAQARAGARPSARGGLRASIAVSSLEPGQEGKTLGVRELASPSEDCQELASALILTVSLALDPAHLLRGSEPAPTPPAVCPVCPVCPAAPPASSATPVSAATPAAVATPAKADETGASSFRGFSAGAGAGFALGALPEASGVLEVMLGATFEHFAVQLEGAAHPGVEAIPVAAGDSLRASLLLGRLALCGRYALRDAASHEQDNEQDSAQGSAQDSTQETAREGRLAFGACGVGGVGSLRGEGLVSGERGSSLSATLGPRLFADLRLFGPVFAQARADLGAVLVRTSLIQSGAPSWSTPAVFFELSGLVFVRFP